MQATQFPSTPFNSDCFDARHCHCDMYISISAIMHKNKTTCMHRRTMLFFSFFFFSLAFFSVLLSLFNLWSCVCFCGQPKRIVQTVKRPTTTGTWNFFPTQNKQIDYKSHRASQINRLPFAPHCSTLSIRSA